MGKDDELPDDPRPSYSHWYDVFLAVDMYGVTPQLEIKGKRKFKTCYGACWSFLAIIIILAYCFYKAIYVMNEAEIAFGSSMVDMVEEILGVSMETSDDLELEFSDVPNIDQSSKVANWYLVQRQGDNVNEVKTVLFLNAVSQKPKSIIFKGVDAVANAGGFLFFIWFFFQMVVGSTNQTLFNRQVLQDTYLAKKNTNLIDIITPKTSKKKGFAKIQKQKINKNEEEDMGDEEMDKSGFDSLQEEGGDTQRSTSKLRSPIISNGNTIEDLVQQNQTVEQQRAMTNIKEINEMVQFNLEDEQNLSDMSSDEEQNQIQMEGGSSKGPASDMGRSRGGYSAQSANRSQAYAQSPGGGSDAGGDGKRRSPRDYQKMEISTSRIICLGLTPRCCRTRGQVALNKLLTKGQSKLHRELDIGQFLKRTRDSQNLVLSYMTSRCFNPNTLHTDYQQHYSNVIDVDLNTERSIEEEFAHPIGVDYLEPQPVCVCPDLGEENLVKIAETAYGILKCETELNQKIGESIRRKKSTKGGGGRSNGGKSHQGDNPSVLEGGWADNMAKLNMSHQSYRTHIQDRKSVERISERPTILAPAESERDYGVNQLDMVNYEKAMQQRLSSEAESSQRKSDQSRRNSHDLNKTSKSHSRNLPRESYGDKGDDLKSQYSSARSEKSPRSRSPQSKSSSQKREKRDVVIKPIPVEEDDLSIIAENTKENTNSLATPINTIPPTPPSMANKSMRRKDDDAVSSKSKKSSRSKSSSKKVKKEVKEDRQDRKVSSSSQDREKRSKSKKKSRKELEVVPESEFDGFSEKTHKSSKSRRHRSKDKDGERSRSRSTKKKRQ